MINANCERKDGQTDGRTDGRTENRTLISHLAMQVRLKGNNKDGAQSITRQQKNKEIRARCYKTFFFLSSVEYEIFPAHKC